MSNLAKDALRVPVTLADSMFEFPLPKRVGRTASAFWSGNFKRVRKVCHEHVSSFWMIAKGGRNRVGRAETNTHQRTCFSCQEHPTPGRPQRHQLVEPAGVSSCSESADVRLRQVGGNYVGLSAVVTANANSQHQYAEVVDLQPPSFGVNKANEPVL